MQPESKEEKKKQKQKRCGSEGVLATFLPAASYDGGREGWWWCVCV